MSIQHPIHHPVMLEETVALLKPHAGGRYLDGTVGMGGHSFAILKAAGEGAELCGLDQDKQALDMASARLKSFGESVHLTHSKYSAFASVLDSIGWEYLDGALIDIGVSSLQLDLAERGFSFSHDGPLDMRMDQETGLLAYEIINTYREELLRSVIAQYGEEPQAKRIARAIVKARSYKSIATTKELAGIIEQAYPASWRAKARNHPATRTFQALRIAVNRELDELEMFLGSILSRVIPGGRVAVISFHSLEDRIVKRYMKSWTQGCLCPPNIPVCICHHKPEAMLITVKPIGPSEKEVSENFRARSAKLRVAEKCTPSKEINLSSKERYEAKKASKHYYKTK